MLAGNSNEKGGNIILVSDGEENVDPNVISVIPEVSTPKHRFRLKIVDTPRTEKKIRVPLGILYRRIG